MTRLSSRRRRAREPLDVQLTVDVIFGDAPDERLRMIDKRNIPMVNSVFEARDTILRQFALLTLRAGVAQPRVFAELVPLVKLLPGLLHREH